MKDRKSSPRHHCPLRNGSKGNCRRLNGYCSAHQIKCLRHDTIHLKTEVCGDCEAEAAAAARKAKEDADNLNGGEDGKKGKDKDQDKGKGKGKKNKH
ncbi:uncharacterized protein F4812DRAFT_455700 [Daldinia caldariorum]|uniref:uncharacterized protein n=1 Tax=Daldinia caldariorum TaxID=326644 RepID=UPI0020087C83|nr:uncharacterized protein F4812DRAFT_455700 [Daldinia caldariorum]KAI1471593.1 hypothetical protein F4812DRAFT_455700 [Daldinia caldariorum]